MTEQYLQSHKKYVLEKGFTVINSVFSDEEIELITETIQNTDTSRENFRKSDDLFAVRQFLKEVPEIKDLVFTDTVKTIVRELFGDKYSTAIYQRDHVEQSQSIWYSIGLKF
ncbi:hypothetical protein ACQWU4_05495 [Chryseobacterium sp. MIQD13]|uniref:hypothetical protein n=1 Tax=Chryseobacterium sp. MIQD13 TaxID=3422310 RepID=UPI003D294AA1